MRKAVEIPLKTLISATLDMADNVSVAHVHTSIVVSFSAKFSRVQLSFSHEVKRKQQQILFCFLQMCL